MHPSGDGPEMEPDCGREDQSPATFVSSILPMIQNAPTPCHNSNHGYALENGIPPFPTPGKHHITSTQHHSKRLKTDVHPSETGYAQSLSHQQQNIPYHQATHFLAPDELTYSDKSHKYHEQAFSCGDDFVQDTTPLSGEINRPRLLSNSTADAYKVIIPSTLSPNGVFHDTGEYSSFEGQHTPSYLKVQDAHTPNESCLFGCYPGQTSWPLEATQPGEKESLEFTAFVDYEPATSLERQGPSIPTSGPSHISVTQRSPHVTDYDYKDAVKALRGISGVEFTPSGNDGEDYFLAESDEEDMIKLIDSFPSAVHQLPPSSVVRDMDADSTIKVFDPSLQRSSPRESPQSGDVVKTEEQRKIEDENLLSSDFDWDKVLDSSLPPQKAAFTSNITSEVAATNGRKPVATEGGTEEPDRTTYPAELRQPISRPPFPSVVRDKSPVTGLSNSSFFRTCFRVGHFISEGIQYFNTKQETTFELYARVTYSSRNRKERVQHFQFADLIKDQHPFPTGTLTGWRTDSLLDRQSSVFLGAGNTPAKSKTCRLICKLTKDKKTDMGWNVVVLSLREVSWEEIYAMKRIICRE
ncbi:hypothetical protein B0H66DRAFT_276212 [Apodospora peruviana]|uniref:Uncharacterized protein n=1 Tax=Apodospora peruviana TaxID=516989 RepID=A0AAE0M1R5_9PEZI|nr:hypothetical protein B0H66DRAFT_276212 [Apodospora peruviana]